MPKVRVNGIDLNYVEAGTGDPLLLIMGFGGDHLAWAFQVPAFSAKYRVIHAYFWERPDVFDTMCLDFLAKHATA